MNTEVGLKKEKRIARKDANSNQSLPNTDPWRPFYAAAKHWKCDLDFVQNELKFFRLLIDRNLSLLINSENIERTRRMVSHVINLECDSALLATQILRHIHDITILVENPYRKDVKEFYEMQSKLEKSCSDFTKRANAVKTEVFEVIERIEYSEKVRKIIDWA